MYSHSHHNHDKARLVNLLASYGIKEQILAAFEQVPRDLFVTKRRADAAYEDRALPIEEGQTISQPSLVAAMIQELGLKKSDKVLEVGTGSGFQTALLSKLIKEVYSIERIDKLAKLAKLKLKQLKINNVHITHGDGSEGLVEFSPYDAIIVSAAFTKVPKPLVEQLKEKGRLIMPVGAKESQEVVLYIKRNGKLVQIRKTSLVSFVPLLGRYGWH